MDLLCFDISLVHCTKLCPRCWSEIDGILNSPKEYEDSVPTLPRPVDLSKSTVVNIYKGR